MDPNLLTPKVQAALGGLSLAAGVTPLWLQIVEGITSVAGMVAAICGAMVGIYGVIRLVRSWRDDGPET